MHIYLCFSTARTFSWRYRPAYEILERCWCSRTQDKIYQDAAQRNNTMTKTIIRQTRLVAFIDTHKVKYLFLLFFGTEFQILFR